MRILHISVLDKKATYQNRDGDIVCGNSDYVIEFAFDAEWNAYEEKTARFVVNGNFENVVFTGTTCPVPIITNASEVKVGVYAGDLSTTTPAIIGCQKSILCESSAPGKSPVINGNSVFVRYSEHADGTDFTETRSSGQLYIGLATGQSAPTDKSEYEWFHIASNIRATEVITLSANAWQNNAQTVTVPCVMNGSAATVSPDTATNNINAYIEHGVILHSLGDRSLTFTCVTPPEIDIVVVAEILDPVASGGGMPEIGDIETPTDSKFIMRDADGNLVAVNPVDPRYPNLAYSYTHSGNKEVYATAVDIGTGVFTAPGHGFTDNTVVVVTVDAPNNIGMPYSFLPKGLLLFEDASSNVKSSMQYYVKVVDEDSFSLATASDGAAVTFTTNSTMDLTKFHFEVIPSNMELEIQDLNAKACLIVVKGKVLNSFRWVHATNRIAFGSNGNRTGGIGYDLVLGVDSYGSCNLGRPGNNYMYSTVEIKVTGNQQAYQVNNNDYVVYSEANVPTFKHVRQYFHMQLTSDLIEGVKLYGDTNAGLFNGTTVEVYTK